MLILTEMATSFESMHSRVIQAIHYMLVFLVKELNKFFQKILRATESMRYIDNLAEIIISFLSSK